LLQTPKCIDRGPATLESVADRLAFVTPPFDPGNIAATADDSGGALLMLDCLQRVRQPGAHAQKRDSVDALTDYLRQFADAGRALLAVSALARSKDRRGRSICEKDALSLASFRESPELESGGESATYRSRHPSRGGPPGHPSGRSCCHSHS